jgi:hypothetical protein
LRKGGCSFLGGLVVRLAGLAGLLPLVAQGGAPSWVGRAGGLAGLLPLVAHAMLLPGPGVLV